MAVIFNIKYLFIEKLSAVAIIIDMPHKIKPLIIY